MLDNYTLSDGAIAQIAKVLQVAILTGTDITDNLRLMRFVQTDQGKLTLDPEYENSFNKNLEKMLEDVQNITEDVNESE